MSNPYEYYDGDAVIDGDLVEDGVPFDGGDGAPT